MHMDMGQFAEDMDHCKFVSSKLLVPVPVVLRILGVPDRLDLLCLVSRHDNDHSELSNNNHSDSASYDNDNTRPVMQRKMPLDVRGHTVDRVRVFMFSPKPVRLLLY